MAETEDEVREAAGPRPRQTLTLTQVGGTLDPRPGLTRIRFRQPH